jgi:hypothetical protein
LIADAPGREQLFSTTMLGQRDDEGVVDPNR